MMTTVEVSSPNQLSGLKYSTSEKDRLENGQRTDAASNDLEDGAMVVMYYSPGMLATVRQNGKYWDLAPLAVPEESTDRTLHFFPHEAVFTVIRRGRFVGFKSVIAEGRTLQASTADDETPLRVNNFNFGPWESWEATSAGFINKKWPQKLLGLDVQEVQIVSLGNLKSVEKQTLKNSRDLHKQIKNLEVQRHKLEKELAELGRSRRRMATQHSNQLEESRSQLDELLATKQKLEVDAVQMGTQLRRQDLQIHKLTLQRDTATARVTEIEQNHRSEERQVELLKEKYEAELEALERSHCNEIESMKRDQDHQVDRAVNRTHEEVNVLKQRLEQADGERDRDVRRIQGERDNAARQFALERDQLKDEIHRLANALQIVHQKIQHGLHAFHREEFHPSFRNGYDDRIRSGGASPLQMQRFSPALSRNSNRRGEEFADNTTPLERSATSVDPLTTHYFEKPNMAPFESYSARSSLDFTGRRADSRLSDNTKLNTAGEEHHGGILNKKHHLESRRSFIQLSDRQISRHSTALSDSVDDSKDDKLSKELASESSEEEIESGQNPREELHDDCEDNKEDEHVTRMYVRNEDDNIAVAEEKYDTDTKSIDSDSTSSQNVGNNNIPTQPKDLLTETNKGSDSPQLLVEDGTSSMCLHADILLKEESIES